jgi:hypothetical protein
VRIKRRNRETKKEKDFEYKQTLKEGRGFGGRFLNN